MKKVLFFWLTHRELLRRLPEPFRAGDLIIIFMKTKTRLVMAAAFAVAMGGASAQAVDKQAIKEAFATAPGAEVPFIASKLVLKANKAEKAETAIEVLRAAVAKKPATCVSVVSFICSLVPESAPELAAEAVRLAPSYAKGIARAASKAAPSKAGEITVALVKVTNKAKHQSIYNTVVASVPTLLTRINQAVLAGGSSDSKGTITTVNAPIAALKADGTVDSSSTAAFPSDPPAAVTANEGVDPRRYNAP